MAAVAEHLPEARHVICWVDRIEGFFDAASEPHDIAETPELGIPRFEQLALALNPTAFSLSTMNFNASLNVSVAKRC